METANKAVENYLDILRQIDSAADHPVTLVGVTKTVEVPVINAVLDAGLSVIGENRVQEFLSKVDDYHLNGVKVHFIGSLQRNKVKYIIDKVDMIESVDSIPLAEEISKRALQCGRVMPVLLEVNIDAQQSKSGFAPEEVLPALGQISQLAGTEVMGLMCIPDPAKTPESFVRMQTLFYSIQKENIPGIRMEVLSMGMSGDYKAAIRHGATMVRVGSGIFGKRAYPEPDTRK